MVKIRGQSLGQMMESEVLQFISWAKATWERGNFDINIIGYPRCAMLITSNSLGPSAYLPCQTVLMAECFIPKPDATKREKVESLKAFDGGLMEIAKGMKVGDVYLYVPKAELDYAAQLMRSGWKEIDDVRLFKKPTGVSVEKKAN